MTMQEDEFLSRCVVDPSKRRFYLYSDEGNEKVVECQTIDQFMDLLQLVREFCSEETLAYSEPL